MLGLVTRRRDPDILQAPGGNVYDELSPAAVGPSFPERQQYLLTLTGVKEFIRMVREISKLVGTKLD